MSAVGVPLASGTAIDLDEPHPALHQAASQQAKSSGGLGGRIVQTVKGEGFGRLAREVDGFGCLGLHAERQLVALDPGIELGLVGSGEKMTAIEPA